MNWWKTKKRWVLQCVARGYCFILFSVGGISKLLAGNLGMRDDLTAMALPLPIVQGAIALAPWVEISLGVWFLVRKKEALRNGIACALLLVFTVYLLTAQHMGLTYCHCFGDGILESVEASILRDLLSLAILVLLMTGSRQKTDNSVR